MNGNEHVWIPSSPEQQQWLRMSIQYQAEVTSQEKGTPSLAVRIQEFREFKRTFMERLLRSMPDNVIDAPIGKDGAKIPLSMLGQSRKALLVWAQQNDIRLDHAAVSQLFPIIIEQRELLDAWLVEIGENKVSEQKEPVSGSRKRGIPDDIFQGQFGIENVSPMTPEENHLQQRIIEEEDSFLKFGHSILLPLVDRLPEESAYQKNLKLGLQVPIKMLESNQHNPYRNSAVLRRKLNGSEADFITTMQGIPNPQYYGYWVFPQEHQNMAIAAFEPMRRTMMLPGIPFEPNVFYELIKMHELVHVYQASQHRKEMGLQNYLQFYIDGHKEQRNLLEDEVQAYGQEIEGLNLLLNGQLKEQGRQGVMVDDEEVQDRLKIPGVFQMSLKMILYFAKYYYERNEENGIYPSEFIEQVKKMLIFDGYKVYTLKNGVARPIPV